MEEYGLPLVVLSLVLELACSAWQLRLCESVSRLLCLQGDPVLSKEGVLRVLTRRMRRVDLNLGASGRQGERIRA